MDQVFDILKILIPALIVFFTAFYFFKYYLKNEEQKANKVIISKNQEILTPLRIQAYERLVLFLERINPESLVIRTNKTSLKVNEYEKELLGIIRNEFEHNLSQQIFISPNAWERVKKAKSDVISIIQQSAQQCKADDPSINLSAKILETTVNQSQLPIADAIANLKEELRTFF